MTLSQDQLRAFYEVSRQQSFTKAAFELGITQSALSHRIRKLEEQLETTLIIRDPAGARITGAGSRLLEFCRLQSQIETEFLADLTRANRNELKGHVRIAGASTLLWSVVVPALSDLFVKHPSIQFEMLERELRQLPELLQNGRVDFIITCGKVERANFEGTYLGEEMNVLIESKNPSARCDDYLDHDSNDQVTIDFLRHQGIRKPKFNRCFLDNITGIISGVEAGLGKAVVPLHLLKGLKSVKIVAPTKPMSVPVYLYILRQPFYTKLQTAVIKELTEKVGKALS